ncbi:ABC transporter permease [Anaerocolumna sp. MB42-C2]|uniref:ABC transporter permease n=1 Tax=Anaerocolumna sp. MB42-C2 TaxID=3070997 RepID=UPI0027E01FF3|nr:ABC transporter permease [Anaerocolumna sp. MB42-C2]WMJ87906.1 ABC transporter permease [Anaerocolumna sp. MB42-C2]
MFSLLIKDCKELLQNKKRILFTILVLIIFIISTYYNAKNQRSTSDNRIRFGVADEDNSVYSKLLIEYFKENENFASYIKIAEGNKQELENLFHNGQIDLLLQIPIGFAEDMMLLKHQPIKVLISTTDVAKAVLIRNMLDSYEKYIRAVEVNCVALFNTMEQAGMKSELINKKNVEISYELIYTALGKDKFFAFKEVNEFPVSSLATYYGFALLTILLNFIGLYVGFLISKEKRSGILKRLFTVGITVPSYLLEKILFSAGIIFILISAFYMIPALLVNKGISAIMELFILSAVLFSVCFAVFLSGLFYDLRKFMLAGNYINFLFAIMGGGIIPILYMPGFMVKFSSLTPNYWMVRAMLSIQKGINGDYIFKIITVLILGALVFYALSISLYRREEVTGEE